MNRHQTVTRSHIIQQRFLLRCRDRIVVRKNHQGIEFIQIGLIQILQRFRVSDIHPLDSYRGLQRRISVKGFVVAFIA